MDDPVRELTLKAKELAVRAAKNGDPVEASLAQTYAVLALVQSNQNLSQKIRIHTDGMSELDTSIDKLRRDLPG